MTWHPRDLVAVIGLGLAFTAIGLGCPSSQDDDTAADDDDDSVVDDDDSSAGDDDDDTSTDDDDSAAVDDADGDGWTVEAGDCDDANAEVYPGADEIPCDGVDNDCDEATEDQPDGDGDGAPVCTDCDDGDAEVHPGADDVCNGIDDDCDGILAPDDTDVDVDGYPLCAGDCDDDDAAVYPGATGIIEVPADYLTIQEAIDAASAGETVCVSPGDYRENLVFHGQAVKVVGVDGPSATLIDGGAAGSVVGFHDGEGPLSVLKGFTLTHGQAGNGGGIDMSNASPTLVDLVVKSNVAEVMGGGVYGYGSYATLNDVVIEDNVVTDGSGGGVYFWAYSYPVLDGVRIEGNVASDSAGGIMLWRGGGTWNNVQVTGNTSSASGGGVYLELTSPTLENLVVAGNQSGHGGGMFLIGCDPPIDNAVIVGNEAEDGGGVFSMESEPELTNVILANNWAVDDGGGWHDHGMYAEPTFQYCAAWANVPENYHNIDDPTGVDGNITADPMFLDVSAADPWLWDLHLDPASDLVDAGDPALLDPDGSPSDIGAFGGPGAGSMDLDGDGFPLWWQPGPYDASTYPALGWDCNDLDATVYPGAGC